MFFKISKNKDNRFPTHYVLSNRYWLNCDNGWTEIWTKHGFAYFKGYCFERSFTEKFACELFENPVPRFTGNFVAVLADQTGFIKLTNDIGRSFPLWHTDSDVGNIGVERTNPIWVDRWINIADKIECPRWDLSYNSAWKTIPRNEVIDQIHNSLTAKFNWLWLNVEEPVKVFYSGGIDTLTCISYLRALNIPHQLVDYEHFEYDQFTCEFHSELVSNWGYTQMHHWKEPTWLVTGACGDEYFMRGPTTANMFLRSQGTTVLEVLKPEHYHYSYFQTEEKLIEYKRQAELADMIELTRDVNRTKSQIVNMCANDHQHWHLGNTLTFTPFKDLDILKLILQLDTESLTENIVDASVQKELIRRNCPDLLACLPNNKNSSATKAGIYQLKKNFYQTL